MTVSQQIIYRRQFVEDFQVGLPLLADRFTQETMVAGKSAVFDIHEFGGRMSKRSIDGRIPRRERTNRQVTISLDEYVDKEEITDFEMFTAQSDERAKINRALYTRANDEIDYTILNVLAQATNEYSASAVALTQDVATKVIAKVTSNKIPIGASDLTWITSTYGEGKLQNINGYTSSDFVASKPLEGGGNQWNGQRKVKDWLGAGWIVHPNLPGAGTASCTNYIVHRSAIGIACPASKIQYEAGRIPGELAEYASCAMVMGAGVLQQIGIWKFYVNDTL